MKIKITNCNNKSSWYYDMIGKTFKVLRIDLKEKRYITHIFGICENFVSFSNCEVLNEDISKGERSEAG